MALPILAQKVESPTFSLGRPAGLAIFLRDLDSDRRAKTEIELFWYYVFFGLRRILGCRMTA